MVDYVKLAEQRVADWDIQAGKPVTGPDKTKIYIYALVDRTNKIRYVGQTTNVKTREIQHSNKIKKYDLRLVVLEKIETIDILGRERQWIKLFLGRNEPLLNKVV